jgi:hypothetical protein
MKQIFMEIQNMKVIKNVHIYSEQRKILRPKSLILVEKLHLNTHGYLLSPLLSLYNLCHNF